MDVPDQEADHSRERRDIRQAMRGDHSTGRGTDILGVGQETDVPEVDRRTEGNIDLAAEVEVVVEQEGDIIVLGRPAMTVTN